MSFNLTAKRARGAQTTRRSGAAFIVEALILLAFLAAASAIFVQLFAAAVGQSAESAELSNAVAIASNTAERFAADPSSVGESETVDDFIVTCTTSVEKRAGGDLRLATISVYRAEDGIVGDVDDPVYTISTARYDREEAS